MTKVARRSVCLLLSQINQFVLFMSYVIPTKAADNNSKSNVAAIKFYDFAIYFTNNVLLVYTAP